MLFYEVVVSSSAEFEIIPTCRHEDALLRRIYDRVPVKLDRADFETSHFKTFLLLQAHFSRLQLSPDLAAVQSPGVWGTDSLLKQIPQT